MVFEEKKNTEKTGTIELILMKIIFVIIPYKYDDDDKKLVFFRLKYDIWDESMNKPNRISSIFE